MYISIKFCSLLTYSLLDQTSASIHDRIGYIEIVQFEALQEIRNKKAHNQLHCITHSNQCN